ncbi:Gfo/Idh/MocA family oxidoreductase [Lichenicola cladoniae]|uniref:Gfo/Idh/MocA family oxidoreductase n=1 Tax=Lichenicola cladoniae TaxID=1484109 RepID=A0A6M8HUI7_9PROT|nr:Gfo/Idh/MocA family oxidoreductase [Lichenicola cladoniae]NPD66144.1 Gfo/Idh/MocA family oxidoreductase [Acetobacteraceae bacterium]QKE92012.1 Gfo/Idh/MocA family oxidoreductase [Lichenicola cladoniae]
MQVIERGRGIGIGLIGSGFMGRAHALAFRNVGGVFPLAVQPRLEILADTPEQRAIEAATSFGFARATGDWTELVRDPAIDLVAITTPNRLHAPIALAAIEAGKHVYCEKPLATTLADAIAMEGAAKAAGIVTMVGFNYLKNPIIDTAREIVRSGEIGEITGFRGIHAEDFMADPEAQFSWRCEPEQAGGALADIGSHILSMARSLLGEVESVCGRLDTIHGERPLPDGSRRAVGVDDQANMLVRFAGRPFTASISASWLASGRDMQLAFEISGTRGALSFTQERFNELRFYKTGQPTGRKGFTTINAGPAHGDYAAFCPAPGHQIGFNDLKTIEVRRLLDAVAGKAPSDADFGDALMITRVMEAVRLSSQRQRWVALSEIDGALSSRSQ